MRRWLNHGDDGLSGGGFAVVFFFFFFFYAFVFACLFVCLFRKMGCGSLGRHRNSRLVSMSIEMWSAKTPRRKTRMGVDFYVEKKTRDLFCAFESIVHAEGRLNQSNQ